MEGTGPRDISSVAGGGWGGCQPEQGLPVPIPAHPRPQTSIHPSLQSHRAQFNLGLPVFSNSLLFPPWGWCHVPWGMPGWAHGSAGERVPGHGGVGFVPALPRPRVWLGKARHVPSVVELALQVVGIETMKGCNTSLGFFF